VALRIVPGDIGDRAQHRIEHDGARHLGAPNERLIAPS
jgi:hypothetical protein